MSHGKVKRYAIAILSIFAAILGIPILGFLALTIFAYYSDYIVISVKNHSGYTLTKVNVFTEAGSIPIASIQDEQVYEYVLRYSGPASSLGIRFSSAPGTSWEKDCDVYMESGFKGYVTVNVDRKGHIACESYINIGFP